MPIVGIEPAIKPAVERNHGGRILVMATPMTIAQPKYHNLLAQYEDQADIVSVPCGGLMEFVEQGNLDGDELDVYFEEHLTPFLTNDTEAIVLGCTHYPFLRHHLRTFLGEREISLIDGSLGTAMELKRRLARKGLLRTEERKGDITIENSSDKPEMVALSYKLLAMPVEE
jgi:glutamate racemase